MTFKESHIPGMPHSNNISQLLLGTGLSNVLWVAGYRLWSRRVHMWRVHRGVSPHYEMFFKIWIVFGVILDIFQSQICWLNIKISWDLKELIPANFVLFYLNEGQNLLRKMASDGQISTHATATEHKIIFFRRRQITHSAHSLLLRRMYP
jgi:hypothetical protein